MMPPDLFAFMLFAIAVSVTPGPNNIMVAASAANHGVHAVIPHMVGINLGFGIMLALVGLGLAGPLAASPVLHATLRWVGGAWMLWIAWGIFRADPVMPSRGRTANAPMGFAGGALFQWVNPKAWVIAVVANTTYTVPGHGLVGLQPGTLVTLWTGHVGNSFHALFGVAPRSKVANSGQVSLSASYGVRAEVKLRRTLSELS